MAGKPAARLTDMHTCPMTTGPVPHVGGPIVGPGAPTVLVVGLPAARVGDLVTCVGPPDTIAMGSPTVLIGGQPAARMGDQTTHGGVIILGAPTVLIGQGGGGGGGGASAGVVLAAAPSAPDASATALTRDQVTWRLQHDTMAAAKRVDALGDDALTEAQVRAAERNPNLRAAYRGSAIDKDVREQVRNDPLLKDRLGGRPNRGVDFTDAVTGQKYDMTTPGQVDAHLGKYGSDTIVLDTNGTQPIMPEGEPVPLDVPEAVVPSAPPMVAPAPLAPEPEVIPEIEFPFL